VRVAATKSQEFADQAWDNKTKHTDPMAAVPPEYCRYSEVFAKDKFDVLPPKRPWDHAVELKPNAEMPSRTKVYPLLLAEQKELDVFLKEDLDSGHIWPCKSPIAASFFFVQKKDGLLRLVQDYCKLNTVTVKNGYPLPLIEELINKLQHA
jgi:hypothetical protein